MTKYYFVYTLDDMNQVILSVKVDPKLKKEVQEFAERVGLSVSAIVNNQLRTVLSERRVEFEEELEPNAKTARQLLQAEKNWQSGKNISGTYKSIQELEKHLNSLGHAD